MSFQRYPSYKDSGVEWLGEVPEHWEVRRLKSIIEEPLKYGANESAELDDRTLPRFVRITDIDSAGGLRDDTFKSLPVEIAEQYLLKEGDILLARSGATVGKSFIYSAQWGTACFAGYLIRARLKHTICLPRWLYYFCQTKGYWGYVVGCQIQATIQNVSAEKYANLYLPFPQISEQTQIAAFLDHETTKIDELVAEQRRLMELLKEKRSAVISHAVTKGLNPHAPMKPSGIEWLGDVPKHWTVMSAKRVSSVFVPQRNKPDLNAEGDGLFWVTMDQMRSEEINSAELSVTESAARAAGTRVLPAGSVVASCVGTFGLAAINNVDVIINQQLQAFIPTDRIDAKFMRHCVLIAEGYFEQIGTAATIAYVNQLGFANMPMALPPKVEQHQIVQFLVVESAKFDTLTTEAQRAIALLQERRSALISAAVTGQIDVRE
jgi:type I restriction enzyme S subunit